VTINDANAEANPHLLSWTAAESPGVPWLVLANAGGGDGDAVTLSASLAGLTAGDYNTTVVITDDDASNSPRSISVGFHVAEGTPNDTASFIGAGCGGGASAMRARGRSGGSASHWRCCLPSQWSGKRGGETSFKSSHI